ncbi:MAG: hypothetical protein ACRCTI_19315 [Beijerinckiaceae bacterium]
MIDRRELLALVLAFQACRAAAQSSASQAAARSLAGKHPAEYYKRAAELLQSGQRDDAVFVFYLGQLRYRTHLAARPDLKRDGDPALFASLSEVVGRPVNEYAFGDMPRLLATLDDIMVFDRANPDRFTPREEFPEAYKRIRDGMQGFRSQMEAQAQDIKRQRAASGLPNRW